MSRIGDTVSLFEAIRLLDSWRERQGTRTDGGKEYTSADTLYAALRSGAIRASGCIDRHQRREISPDEWQDYDLVLKSGFFPNAQFLNAPGMTIIEVISKRVYPPTNVTLKPAVAPRCDCPHQNSEIGDWGYHRVIEDVALSREDVQSLCTANGAKGSPRLPRQRIRPVREAAAAAIDKRFPEGVPDPKTCRINPYVPQCKKCWKAHHTARSQTTRSFGPRTAAAGKRRCGCCVCCCGRAATSGPISNPVQLPESIMEPFAYTIAEVCPARPCRPHLCI